EFKAFRKQAEQSPEQHLSALEELRALLAEERARRAQAEQSLLESETRLQELAGNIDERLREQYRSIPVPTYSWQRIVDEFVLVDFNDAAAESMGRIGDFFGKKASDIFKDRPEVLADFARCYREKGKVVRKAPYTLITSGEERFFVTTYNFVPPTLIIVHIQDITEQRAMEEELQQYRQQFGSLDGNLQNRPEDVLPDGAATGDQTNERLEELVRERTAELVRMNKQLQREIFEHERAEMSLREAKDRLRAQYKNIPIPTYSWRRVGDDFVLVDYNHAAEKNSQGRIANFMSKTASQVFKDRPQVLADLSSCFTHKAKIVRKAPYKLITTGETRYFITTYNYSPPNLVIVYIQDMTEIKQLEAAIAVGRK
ncbi:MAG: hypothetical protein R3264_07660, partial [Anaerolineae bacterium]|nr:hypothetical protein [Anaerolineae bacterium]